MLTFILGGARSGKSRRAQQLAEAMPGDRVFIATAEPLDAEMAERIARHRSERGDGWRTVEAPIALAAAVRTHGREGQVLLVDCLTLWMSNILLAEANEDDAVEALVEALAASPHDRSCHETVACMSCQYRCIATDCP